MLLTIPVVYAAEIHGTIYDLSLKPVKNVLIEINTQPPQKLVSRDGTYQFSLTEGNYTIKARTISEKNLITEENIELIGNTGEFVLDLFLLPEETEQKQEKTRIMWYIIPIFIITLIIVYFIRKKPEKSQKEEKEERSDLDRLIKIIQDKGGRTTQKEIRKHFPLSEAKVSLMITELESKGKIEKIKKGRGNIIILK